MRDVDIEAAVPDAALPSGFRRWLAILVGLAAVSAAGMTWVEDEAGRREDKARVDASRAGLEVFRSVAATQSRQQFELDALRRVTVTEGLGAVRVSEADVTDLTGLQVALGLSVVDNETARRLIELGRATSTYPDDAQGVDAATIAALATPDQAAVDRIIARQSEHLEEADQQGTRQGRAILAIGLVAIAASLLGLAGLMGDGRGGRLSLRAAAVGLVVALGWGLSGFLV